MCIIEKECLYCVTEVHSSCVSVETDTGIFREVSGDEKL